MKCAKKMQGISKYLFRLQASPPSCNVVTFCKDIAGWLLLLSIFPSFDVFSSSFFGRLQTQPSRCVRCAVDVCSFPSVCLTSLQSASCSAQLGLLVWL